MSISPTSSSSPPSPLRSPTPTAASSSSSAESSLFLFLSFSFTSRIPSKTDDDDDDNSIVTLILIHPDSDSTDTCTSHQYFPEETTEEEEPIPGSPPRSLSQFSYRIPFSQVQFLPKEGGEEDLPETETQTGTVAVGFEARNRGGKVLWRSEPTTPALIFVGAPPEEQEALQLPVRPPPPPSPLLFQFQTGITDSTDETTDLDYCEINFLRSVWISLSEEEEEEPNPNPTLCLGIIFDPSYPLEILLDTILEFLPPTPDLLLSMACVSKHIRKAVVRVGVSSIRIFAGRKLDWDFDDVQDYYLERIIEFGASEVEVCGVRSRKEFDTFGEIVRRVGRVGVEEGSMSRLCGVKKLKIGGRSGRVVEFSEKAVSAILAEFPQLEELALLSPVGSPPSPDAADAAGGGGGGAPAPATAAPLFIGRHESLKMISLLGTGFDLHEVPLGDWCHFIVRPLIHACPHLEWLIVARGDLPLPFRRHNLRSFLPDDWWLDKKTIPPVIGKDGTTVISSSQVVAVRSPLVLNQWSADIQVPLEFTLESQGDGVLVFAYGFCFELSVLKGSVVVLSHNDSTVLLSLLVAAETFDQAGSKVAVRQSCRNVPMHHGYYFRFALLKGARHTPGSILSVRFRFMVSREYADREAFERQILSRRSAFPPPCSEDMHFSVRFYEEADAMPSGEMMWVSNFLLVGYNWNLVIFHIPGSNAFEIRLECPENEDGLLVSGAYVSLNGKKVEFDRHIFKFDSVTRPLTLTLDEIGSIEVDVYLYLEKVVPKEAYEAILHERRDATRLALGRRDEVIGTSESFSFTMPLARNQAHSSSKTFTAFGLDWKLFCRAWTPVPTLVFQSMDLSGEVPFVMTRFKVILPEFGAVMRSGSLLYGNEGHWNFPVPPDVAKLLCDREELSFSFEMTLLGLWTWKQYRESVLLPPLTKLQESVVSCPQTAVVRLFAASAGKTSFMRTEDFGLFGVQFSFCIVPVGVNPEEGVVIITNHHFFDKSVTAEYEIVGRTYPPERKAEDDGMAEEWIDVSAGDEVGSILLRRLEGRQSMLKSPEFAFSCVASSDCIQFTHVIESNDCVHMEVDLRVTILDIVLPPPTYGREEDAE